MSNSNNSTTTYVSGISFTGLLFITFLVLKLTHIIDWSWWWVTCPLWGGIAIILGIILIVFVVIGIQFAIQLIVDR